MTKEALSPNARASLTFSSFVIRAYFVIRHSDFVILTSADATILRVSSLKIHGSILAARTENEPSHGDTTAARASRLIHKRPRYISAQARVNSRKADC